MTSVIGPESLLVATFACVGFSRENHRPDFRDFCNTIGHKRTPALQHIWRNLTDFLRLALMPGAQGVNGDLALDAFYVDNLCVGLHRGQQVSGARQAIHFVA